MTRDEAIAAITGRLVEHYRPERIYLFGSEARGDAGPDSDLDFCVVVPDDAPVELLRDGGIYSVLRSMGYPKDIVPWRRSDFEARAAHIRASLPATVVREGRLLYDSRPVAACSRRACSSRLLYFRAGSRRSWSEGDAQPTLV